MGIVKPSELAKHKAKQTASGFTRATQQAKRRLILSIEGEEKSGKNHFAFTAPGPIYFHDIDFGADGVIQKFQDDKEIQAASYSVDVPVDASIQAVSDAASPVWEEFKTNYTEGIQSGRTTVIDTGTDIYELLRMSRFGKLTQVMPHHYGPVNQEMKAIYRAAYSSDTNLIVLHRVKDEWINKVVQGKEKGEKTGRRVFAGYSGTYYETQVNARAYKEDGEFYMLIFDCRQNPAVEGMVLSGDMLNFATLGTLVFPDSEPSDWE